MHPTTLTPEFLERYFAGFAQRLADAPGASHLSELAETSQAVPESALRDLMALMTALHPDAVASTLAVRAREVADDGMRYDDATDFVRALSSELQGYVDQPEVMAEALNEIERKERGRVH